MDTCADAVRTMHANTTQRMDRGSGAPMHAMKQDSMPKMMRRSLRGTLPSKTNCCIAVGSAADAGQLDVLHRQP